MGMQDLVSRVETAKNNLQNVKLPTMSESASISSGLQPIPSTVSLNDGQNEGSGEWGADIEDRNLGDYATKTALYGVAGAAEAGGLTNAARHMRHFLDNSGEPLNVNVNDMLRDMPGFQEQHSQMQAEARQLVNQRIAEMGNIEQVEEFTIKDPNWNEEDKTKTRGYTPTRKESSDWWYAMGSFNCPYTAEVTVTPVADGSYEVTMDFKVHVYDDYNWDAGKVAPIFGVTVPDGTSGRLHSVGLAQEYQISGTSSVTTEWTAPHSVETQHETYSDGRNGTRSDPARERS